MILILFTQGCVIQRAFINSNGTDIAPTTVYFGVQHKQSNSNLKLRLLFERNVGITIYFLFLFLVSFVK